MNIERYSHRLALMVLTVLAFAFGAPPAYAQVKYIFSATGASEGQTLNEDNYTVPEVATAGKEDSWELEFSAQQCLYGPCLPGDTFGSGSLVLKREYYGDVAQGVQVQELVCTITFENPDPYVSYYSVALYMGGASGFHAREVAVLDGDETFGPVDVYGVLQAYLQPDGRWTVWFDRWNVLAHDLCATTKELPITGRRPDWSPESRYAEVEVEVVYGP